MSRDDRDTRPRREASLSEGRGGNPGAPRSASTQRAVPSDRLLPREFVSQLYRLAGRDAELLEEPARVSERWLAAAEIAEFGLDDLEAAEGAARLAADAERVDGRVYSTLRRAARARQTFASLAQNYAEDATKSIDARDRVIARLGEIQLRLRAGGDAKEVIATLGRLKEEVEGLEPEVIALWRSISEDALIAIGKSDRATELRAQRWAPFRDAEETTDNARAALALSTAALAEHAGLQARDVLSWYDTAFKSEPSLSAARPVFRWAWREKNYELLDTMLEALATHSDDVDVRGSANYQLGMLRAHRRSDVERGLAALSSAASAGTAAGLGASAFLSLARSSHGSAVPDEVVDALTARLSFAASGMESADLLTQMAERFDAELQFPDVAVDMALEALGECPHWTPALRLLGHIYARDGHWEKLVELHTQQLAVERDPDELRKLHERIAEVAHEQLHQVPIAELHLNEALKHGWRASNAQRLARILRELSRWDELFALLVRGANASPARGEKLRYLEEAAHVAESQLHDVERAISAWSEALAVDPSYSAALAALERIFLKSHRWEDLLRLCVHELSLVEAGNDAASLTLLVRCADIARNRLLDHHRAEEFYARALQIDPLYDDALRGLGQILKEQARWHDLVTMTEAEHEHARSPERRAKSLRQIGELHVRQLNDLEGALVAYRRLGALGSQWHEEALLWMERLYEATDDPSRLHRVLQARRDVSEDPIGRAKLSFRIAELLEWELQRYDDALVAYVDALDEPSVAGEVVAALERCLAVGDVSAEARSSALESLSESLSELSPDDCRAALDLLLAQARAKSDTDAIDALLETLHASWPSDRLIAEQVAVRALSRGEWSEAEAARSAAPIDGADAMRGIWRTLDAGEALQASSFEQLISADALNQWLRRELGVDGSYEGADDRELLQLIERSELSLGELLDPGETWMTQNLAVFAARTLQDLPRLEAGLERLAAQAGEPLLEMRLWMDAGREVAVPDEMRQRWLRRAAETGNFGHPLREDLYRALHTTGDEDGLVLALRAHVESGAAEGDALATLAFRMGRALDGLNRNDEAIAALRLAAVHAPANPEIALEKARVEALAGDLDAARSTMEAALVAGCPPESHLDIYHRLTDLHMLEGGDRVRLIQALEEAFKLSGRSREVGLRLAETHLQHGDAARGAALLPTLLQTPMQEDELRYWLLLGRSYAHRLEDLDRADELLWSCFDAFPERNEAISQLEELAVRSGRASVFASTLRSRLESPDGGLTRDRRAKLWMKLGDFQLGPLARPQEAERSFEAAIEAGAPRGLAESQRALAMEQQGGRAPHAASTLVQAIAAEDFELRTLPDVLVNLDRLYSESQDTSRLRSVRQIRRVFGHNTPEVGLAERRVLDAPIDANRLAELVGSESLSSRERFVLGETSALAFRVFGKRGEQAMKIEQARYRSENFGYFDQHLHAACEMLGVEVPRLNVAVNAAGAMTFDGQTFYVPGSRVGDDFPASAKFWAGWIAATFASKLGVYSQLEDRDIQELLAAVAKRGGLDGVDDADLGLYDEIGGMMNLTARRAAELALRAAPEVAQRSGGGRSTAIRAIGDRFGAAYCDHPGAALYEIVRVSGVPLTGGPLVADELLATPRVLSLVRFLVSDRYLRARDGLGVGPRL